MTEEKYPNRRGSAARDGSKAVRVGTHLKVLTAVLDSTSATHVLEHGMGNASTPFLHGRQLATVLSFENEERWQKCESCLPDQRLRHLVMGYPGGTRQVTEAIIAEEPDVGKWVALVDGPGNERTVVVQACLSLGVGAVVEHDAETLSRADLELRIDLARENDYRCFQHVDDNPETILYTREVPASLIGFIDLLA